MLNYKCENLWRPSVSKVKQKSLLQVLITHRDVCLHH